MDRCGRRREKEGYKGEGIRRVKCYGEAALLNLGDRTRHKERYTKMKLALVLDRGSTGALRSRMISMAGYTIHR